MSLGDLVRSIGRWAEATFGDQHDDDTITRHLVEEVDEYREAVGLPRLWTAPNGRPKSSPPEELADAFIVWSALVWRRPEHGPIVATIAAKMSVNRRRRWAKAPDGLIRHVGEGS